MKRDLQHSSRHNCVQLSQAHVNHYTKEDGDSELQPRHKLKRKQATLLAEGGKEVRDAALVNLVVWPCLAQASDADFKDKWQKNFKVGWYLFRMASTYIICIAFLGAFG